MKAIWHAAITIIVIVVLAIIAGFSLIYSGVYDVAATTQHNALVAWALHTTALNSISAHSGNIKVPDLSNPAKISRGLRLFAANCAPCHGAPGAAPENFAKGFLPGAPRLAQVGKEWTPRNLYWTIAHGIKMTPMPAWEFRMNQKDLWALVAFIKTLPDISPTAYRTALNREGGPAAPTLDVSGRPARTLGPASKSRGLKAIGQYNCAACHTIPGINEPKATVGPTLAGVGSRRFLAGILPNSPDNMEAWIRNPQKFKPGDAMPDMGVTAKDARDMAAYLESLR